MDELDRIYSLAETNKDLRNVEIKGEQDTGSSEVLRTTVFVEDGIQNIKDLGNHETTDDLVIRDQSIRDFMAKPLMIVNAGWTTASTAMTKLQEVSIAGQLNANSVWTNKYQGFNLVRGTAVVRLQINCNPFQQGKLYLGFIPNYNQATATDGCFTASHLTMMSTMRQIPGVELDCRETTAVLRIPYIAPTHFYNIKTGFYDWGSVFLYVLSPLQTGASGETTVEYTMYLSFEDFELSAPTVPQGSYANKRFKSKTFKKNPSDKEMKALSEGKPISHALEVTSNIASTLAGIPLLTPVAAPVAWAAGVASKIAGYLGWSKPNMLTPPQYMSRQYNHYMPNSDGPDVSYKMALTSTNQIAISDNLTLTQHDEMSIDYLKTIPTIVTSFTWSTSDLIGTSKYSGPIGPMFVYSEASVSHGGHTATYRAGPPVYHLAQYFTMSRGSMKVMLKFVKTDFHTGRIMLTWTPATTTVVAPDYAGSSQLSLRHIIDIREGDYVCLELPYLHGRNYLQSDLQYGQLDITVINILRAPETCASSINVLMYFAGGDDLEFASPAQVIPGAPFYPQVGELECNVIGDGKIPKETTHYAEMSVGEKILSIKQLLNKPTRLWRTVVGSESCFYLWPFVKTAIQIHATTGALLLPNMGGDVYNVVTSWYMYMRGGVRILAQPNGANPIYAYAYNDPNIMYPSTTSSYWGTFTKVLNGGVNSNWSLTGNYVGTNVAIQEPSSSMISLEIPYQTSCQATILPSVVSASGNNYNGNISCPITTCAIQQTDATTCALFRSSSDQFQLSYFIGTTPILISYA